MPLSATTVMKMLLKGIRLRRSCIQTELSVGLVGGQFAPLAGSGDNPRTDVLYWPRTDLARCPLSGRNWNESRREADIRFCPSMTLSGHSQRLIGRSCCQSLHHAHAQSLVHGHRPELAENDWNVISEPSSRCGRAGRPYGVIQWSSAADSVGEAVARLQPR